MLIWWLADDRKLKHPAREIIANPRKHIFASSVVLWEVAIKSALGRIDADVDEIEAAIRETGFELCRSICSMPRASVACPKSIETLLIAC